MSAATTHSIDAAILDRKGARRRNEIPSGVLSLLNQGQIETVNLIEWLAVDPFKLAEAVFPELGLAEALPKLKAPKNATTVASVPLIARHLHEFAVKRGILDQVFTALSSHRSDLVRGMGAHLLAVDGRLDLSQKLAKMEPLADDAHFSVREVAWMAMRPEVASNLPDSVGLLNDWTQRKSANLRRFASEVTRPRGVWCRHIEVLKAHPEMAAVIVESLKADPSRYVQDSVGNWLNDTAKTRPDFVTALARRWRSESLPPETERILRRAMRSLQTV